MEQITENPYVQYFIGLPECQEEALFDASTLALFRKRISAEMLMEVNEYLLAHKDDDNNNTPPSEVPPMIQETIIYRFCKSYGLPLPRRYRRRARKDYLAFAKNRKHSAGKIRKALRKQLGYVARDIRYLKQFMGGGYAKTEKKQGCI